MSDKGLTAAFDVGNTAVKGALLGGGPPVPWIRVPTQPAESLSERLKDAAHASCPALAPHGRCVVSSVCPEADASLRRFWEESNATGPVLFFGADLPVPIPVLVREREKTGVDRLLCALGARELSGAPCVVVGAGTAITVDLVDVEGRFAGGAIAPGFALSAQALHEGASALPPIEPAVPERTAGLDTVEAMQIGVYHSCRAGTAELVRLLMVQAGGDPAVLITGGDAELLLPLPSAPDARRVPELIFLGMAAALGEP